MHDNLPPPRAPLESLFSSVSLHSSPGHAMRKRRDIKALPHQDWKGLHSFFPPFFCLQAVNYLTSTHNEQCKTSQNLIKRQWRGPSADGKWLTQLIKHRGVRLNMASQSHPSAKKKKRMEFVAQFYFPFPLLPTEHLMHLLSWPPQPLFIPLPWKGIYVFTPCCLSANFLSLMNHNANNSEVASTETQRTTV